MADDLLRLHPASPYLKLAPSRKASRRAAKPARPAATPLAWLFVTETAGHMREALLGPTPKATALVATRRLDLKSLEREHARLDPGMSVADMENFGEALGALLLPDEIAAALLDVRRYLFPDYPVSSLGPLARIAWLLSEVEFAEAPGGARPPLRARGDDVAEPTRRAILATVLFERIFAALRRCANSMRSVRISEARAVPPAAYVPADAPAARRGPAKRRRPSGRAGRGARSARKR